MDFTGTRAEIQQRMAATRDLAARRMAVLHELSPRRGERVLDIGCGAGLLLREIGLSTGPHGFAAGVDISADQIEAATRECEGVPGVRATVGSVDGLDYPDAVFDAAVAAHVIEYLDDPRAALAEIRRVLKPGARLVVLATNWDADFWHGPEAELTGPVVAAWRREVPWPNLPAQLGPMLATTGFSALRQVPVPVVNPGLGEDSLALWMSRLLAVVAEESGADARPASWLAALDRADAAGEFFYSSVPILTTAVAV
jgi:SAM-dependent methyltransferase